jgi:hypothetical protein
MVTIALTDEEAVLLGEILEDCLSDLRMEIADTDAMDFREMLKSKKEYLTRLLPRLKAGATT